MRKYIMLLWLLFLILIFANLPKILNKKPAEEYFEKNSVPDEVWDHYFWIRKEMQKEQAPTPEANPEELARYLRERHYFLLAVASLARVDTGFVEEASIQTDRILRQLQQLKWNSADRLRPELSFLLNCDLLLAQHIAGTRVSDLTADLWTSRRLPYSFASALLLLCRSIDGEPVDSTSFGHWQRLAFSVSSETDSAWEQFARWFHPIPLLRPVLPALADSLYNRLAPQFAAWLRSQKPEELKKQPFWPKMRGLVFALAAARECGDRKRFAFLLSRCRIYGRLRYHDLDLVFENANLEGQTALLLARVSRLSEVFSQRVTGGPAK